MTLAEPTNCWTYHEQKFADAVANSTEFHTLVGAANAEAAADKIFGDRLTHSRSGRTWTADELATLGSHARVFPSPDGPYGKHPAESGARVLRPHGKMIVELNRYVPESQLEKRSYDADDQTGLNDAHDRDWRNYAGTIVDQIIDWLVENGGAGPRLPTPEVIDLGETKAANQSQQGMWQVCAFEIAWHES